MIYTSYYAGEAIGQALSISLFLPKGCKDKPLPLFAPTPELLKWWNNSDKSKSAQIYYEQEFSEIMRSRQQLVELWCSKQKPEEDVTLRCFEKPDDFCHRHWVGREIIERYCPDLWVGEIALKRRLEVSRNTSLECLCQDIPLSVLLGQGGTSNRIPDGWEHSEHLAQEPGIDCYVFQVRSRLWVKAVYHDYLERGKFAEVKVGDRVINVFTTEHLAVVKS